MDEVVFAVVATVALLVWLNGLVWWCGGLNRFSAVGGIAACVVCIVPFLWFRAWEGGYLHLITLVVVLGFALSLAKIPRRGVRIFQAVSVALFVATWLTALGMGMFHERQYAKWREQHPFESMADRIPAPKPSNGQGVFAGRPLWSSLEKRLPNLPFYHSDDRDGSLWKIHEHRVNLFKHAAGFGADRMLRTPPEPLHFGPEMFPLIPQGDEYAPDLVSLGDALPAADSHPFSRLHADGLLDFVNPNGFGYVKSRTAVAGFLQHRFTRFPMPDDRWLVTRIELVGLLKHDKPAVYVSELLPRMDLLKDAPTRAPDPFEAEGVKAVRGGEDLFVRGTEKVARMVGAIRSVKQCVECHGGQRGDLLGAFSYRLDRMEIKK